MECQRMDKRTTMDRVRNIGVHKTYCVTKVITLYSFSKQSVQYRIPLENYTYLYTIKLDQILRILNTILPHKCWGIISITIYVI